MSETTDIYVHLDKDSNVQGYVQENGTAVFWIGPVSIFIKNEIVWEKLRDMRHALAVTEGELSAAAREEV